MVCKTRTVVSLRWLGIDVDGDKDQQTSHQEQWKTRQQNNVFKGKHCTKENCQIRILWTEKFASKMKVQ